MSRIFYGLIVCLCLLAPASGVEKAQISDAEDIPNTYDRLYALIDSLTAWSQSPPQSTDSLESAAVKVDSMQIAEWFPGCNIKSSDEGDGIEIIYPEYLGLFTGKLYVAPVMDSLESTDSSQWSISSQVTNETVTFDNLSFPVPPTVEWDSALVAAVCRRIVAFRTAGLPSVVRQKVNFDENSDIIVTVRGRDVVDLNFSLDKWMNALGRISAGMLTYSNLLSVSGDDNCNVFMKYYILITYPEAPGLHFIEWEETLRKVAEEWRMSNLKIVFTPYIRTDNLKNLFGQKSEEKNEGIKLKIGK